MPEEANQIGEAAWRDALLRELRSNTGKILGATILTAAVTLAVKFVTLGRELIVAYRLGAGDEVDAYLLALVLPSYLINVLATSFLNALLPAFTEARREGEASAQEMISAALAFALFVNLPTAALLAIGIPWIIPLIASGFPAEKLDLTVKLYYLLAPIPVLSALSAVMSCVLNALQRFAIVAAIPALVPLASVVALLIGGPAAALYALTVGTVAGVALESLAYALVLAKRGYSIRPRWRSTPRARAFVSEYLYVVGAAIFISASSIIDQSMASGLGSGSVAALNYASKLIALVMTLFSLSLGTTIFPHMAGLAAEKKWERLRRTTRRAILAVFAVAWLPVAVIVVFSSPLVSLLFERGSFLPSHTELVSPIQAVYALQIPFFASGLLMGRLFNSLNENRLLMYVGIGSVALNLALNLLFIPFLGLAGVALSTVVVAAALTLSLVLLARYRIWPARMKDQPAAQGSV